MMMNVVLASSLAPHQPVRAAFPGPRGMVTLGAYTAALLVMKLGISSWLALLAGGVLAAVVSCLIGFPFTRLKGIYFTMVSIFFVQIIVLTVQQWRSLTGGASGLYGIPRPDGFLGIEFRSKISFYFLMLVLTVGVAGHHVGHRALARGADLPGHTAGGLAGRERGYQHHHLQGAGLHPGGFLRRARGRASTPSTCPHWIPRPSASYSPSTSSST